MYQELFINNLIRLGRQQSILGIRETGTKEYLMKEDEVCNPLNSVCELNKINFPNLK